MHLDIETEPNAGNVSKGCGGLVTVCRPLEFADHTLSNCTSGNSMCKGPVVGSNLVTMKEERKD